MSLLQIKCQLSDWLYNAYETSKIYPLIEFTTTKNLIIKFSGDQFGLYVLLWKGKVVYVGKVSGKKVKIRSRLKQHLAKILISTVDPQEIECRPIPVDEKQLIVSLEQMLIEELNPPWNGMDFGGNIKSRDEKQRKKPSLWMKYYVLGVI